MTYQDLVKKEVEPLHINIRLLEPITFIGMYDIGQDFIFNYLNENIEEFNTETVHVKCFSYVSEDSVIAIKSYLLGFDFEKRSLVIAINLSEGVNITNELAGLISSFRDKYTMRFSYIFFAYTNVYNDLNISDPYISKVLFRNIFYVIPKNYQEDCLVVGLYSNRAKVLISDDQLKQIHLLSGGNAGLTKALTMGRIQGIDKWMDPLENDDLRFRIEKICELISNEEVLVLFNKLDEKEILQRLERYGYVKDGKIFSPLIRENLKKRLESIKNNIKLVDFKNSLTSTQITVYKLFEKNQGEILSRDDIAKKIWGDGWIDKYSDWAIDSLIYELRKKLGKFKLGKIIAKKGRGFMYINS